MKHELERRRIIEACRSLGRLGLTTGTSGNISVRAGDGMLISPTGLAYEALEPGDVVAMGWDGSFAGGVAPSSEWRFHRDLLVARPELNAVVHTHSRFATAVGILGRGIPAIHYMVAAAGGEDIRCAGYATFGTEALAGLVVAAMEGRLACLLAHHGVIAAGATLAGAMGLAVTVEELAAQYLAVLPMGEPPVLSGEEMGRVLVKFSTYGQRV